MTNARRDDSFGQSNDSRPLKSWRGRPCRVADQHVRDAAAFRPRQPGGDESVARIELRSHPQRTYP